jgi:Ca2+-binding RTX toxin-like protein
MADIFVATTGNDSSNTGTIDRPFASISRAIDEADPGDNIQVRGGTYYPTRSTWIGKRDSGTAGAPITISGYNNEKPVIDGSSIASSSPIFNINADYINIEGFDIRYSPQAGITVWGADNVRVEDNVIHDTKDTGIFVGYDWAQERPKNVVVENNVVYKSSLKNQSRNASSGWGAGIAAFGSNMSVKNNEVFHNYGEGIGISGENNQVTKNTVYDNFSTNIYLDGAANADVTNNFVYTSSNNQFDREGQPAKGITLASEYSTNQVLNSNLTDNNISNNIFLGGSVSLFYGNFDKGDGLDNTVITNNTFVGGTNETVHIDPDDHSNTKIANNIFYQNNGGQISYAPELAGLDINNNVMWNGSTEIKLTSLGDPNRNIQADPKFVNPGSLKPESYQLQGDSPALSRGIGPRDHTNIGSTAKFPSSTSSNTTPSNSTSNSVAPPSNPSNNTSGNTNNSGTAGNDWLKGTTGNDSLDGKEGDDTIRSFQGNDNLIGGQGNDTLRGGVGNDTLSGGTGKDTMAGDDGYDRFVFDTNKAFNLSNRWNFDSIQNFSVGKDKIVLDKTTFVGLNNVSEFAVVADNTAAATNAAKITYARASGDLFFNADGTDGGFGDGGKIANLTGAPALTASHIVVQA